MIYADILLLIHIIMMVVLVVLTFSNKLWLLILNMTCLFSLLVHWYLNLDVCVLSVIESKLRNIPISSTIFNKIVKPIYNISERTYSNIMWTMTILLFNITLYKIFTHKNMHIILNNKLNIKQVIQLIFEFK